MKIMDYFRSHTKVRDTVLFAAFSVVLLLAFVNWARFDAAKREFLRNMEVAFRQCGVMVQDGKVDELSLKINRLLESEEFRRTGWSGFTHWQQAYDMSKLFRETMLPESVEENETSGVFLLVGFLTWLACFIVWLMLCLFQARPVRRQGFLQVCIVVFVVFLLGGLMGRLAYMGGYFADSASWDLKTLSNALALPEFPPTTLEELQNPRIRFAPYRYLSNQFEPEK